jgi:DNA (cytosine-5)-methyltransferase 1
VAAYYNEFDPKTAAWLRELIKAGLIADGEVDERSITDVGPGDLRGFTQCHFFAGIGGWSYALRLAGWPDDRAVWTGSCPCQPFSVAGKGEGADDPRHLWPAWFPLIRECRPATVFGEQTSSKDGRYWLDLVLADLEGIDYAIGAFDLPAASVGAPHCRQRLWFVADAVSERAMPRAPGEGGGRRVVSHSDRHGQETKRERVNIERGFGGQVDLSDTHGGRRRQFDAAAVAGYQGQHPRASAPAGIQWRIESEPQPVAYGIPARVGRLRGYGNAIVPQVAAEFIAAYLEATGERRGAISSHGEAVVGTSEPGNF